MQVIAGHRRKDGLRVAIKRIAKSGTSRWGWMNGKVVPLELALICQVNEVVLYLTYDAFLILKLS